MNNQRVPKKLDKCFGHFWRNNIIFILYNNILYLDLNILATSNSTRHFQRDFSFLILYLLDYYTVRKFQYFLGSNIYTENYQFAVSILYIFPENYQKKIFQTFHCFFQISIIFSKYFLFYSTFSFCVNFNLFYILIFCFKIFIFCPKFPFSLNLHCFPNILFFNFFQIVF